MNCERRKAALVRLVDGELPPEEESEVRNHAESCSSCGETLRRLAVEGDCLTRALLGRPAAAGTAPRSHWKLIGVSAVLLALLVIGLDRLLGFYSDAGSNFSSAREAEKEEIYDRTLLLRAEGVPLGEFLVMVTDASGVPVRLGECALRRLGAEPAVHFVLLRPIRLGSLVHLIEDFYDLRAEVREGAVRFG